MLVRLGSKAAGFVVRPACCVKARMARACVLASFALGLYTRVAGCLLLAVTHDDHMWPFWPSFQAFMIQL